MKKLSNWLIQTMGLKIKIIMLRRTSPHEDEDLSPSLHFFKIGPVILHTNIHWEECASSNMQAHGGFNYYQGT